MTFHEFTSAVLERVRAVGEGFEAPDDDWLPVLLLERAEGEVAAVALPLQLFASGAAKDLLVELLEGLIRAARARKAALILSIWMRAVPLDSAIWRHVQETDELPAGERMPSEAPDRIEAVQVAIMDAEIQQWWIAVIDRDGVRPPTLGEWEGPSDQVGGRFARVQHALR